jgi:hypothetical protein
MRSRVGVSCLVLPLPMLAPPHTNGVLKMGHSSVAMLTRSCSVKSNGTLSRKARLLALFKYTLRCCSFTDKVLHVFFAVQYVNRESLLTQVVEHQLLPRT